MSGCLIAAGDPPTAAGSLSCPQALSACLITLMCLLHFAGCAAFHPVRGVPAPYVPQEYLGEERSGKQTIHLGMLVRSRPPQHRIEAGDLLAIYIPGILGSVHHTDEVSGESPPINFPFDAHQLPTIGYPILVQDDHTIALPYLPPINVYGLTTEQAAERIRQTALSLGILRSELGKDRVLVTLQKPREYRILVVRQEAANDMQGASMPGMVNVGTSKRGTAHLVTLPAYENDVLHALLGTQGGGGENTGLPGLDAKNYIYIIRGRRDAAQQFPGGGFGPVPPGMPGVYGSPGDVPPGGPWPHAPYSPPMNPGSWGVPGGTPPQGGAIYPQTIIRGQSEVLPIGFWTPGNHQRQVDQRLEPAMDLAGWGHSIQATHAWSAGGESPHSASNFHMVAAPQWQGQATMPIPTPAPLSEGSGVSQGGGGHSIMNPTGPLNQDVPLLHPSLAPRTTPTLPAERQPTPATLDPRHRVPSTIDSRQPMPVPDWSQGGMPSGTQRPYQSPPPLPTEQHSMPYFDPALQAQVASQGSPHAAQWASTLGRWSPTIESPDVIKIPIRISEGEHFYLTEQDITLYDGDIVFIESRDSEVFYTGGLLGGGQFTLPRDNDLTVTQAISIASGSQQNVGVTRAIGGVSALNQDVSNSASRVVILRTLPSGQRVRIEVDLYKAFRYQDEDILIQPGDMILLQYKPLEAVAACLERYLLEGALLGIAAGTLRGGGGN